ncbi:kinesin-like protein KIF9 isoform X4 [Sminthopsis crassicaudata]|uniref:kinesin-like protein KIF9 isoform X4 n=1 Tax=Sminthopsis crassicaudata TaxID=9301 RepID=UPI003D687356
MKRRKDKRRIIKMGTRKKVHAYVRVKPTDEFAYEMITFGEDNKSIDIHIKKDGRRGTVNNQQTDWSFKLDGVLHDASQDCVYDTVAKEVVAQALDGYNGTIMCYGQTGAGKTYTMTGTTENYKHRGILPRALQQVFRMIEERPTHSITVRVSYLEIYNETLFDLLSTLPYVGNSDTPMSIVESPQGIFVKGLSVHMTGREEDAFSLLFEGETNRIIASHTMNKNSSRSHCIFTIYIEAHSRSLSDEKYITSKINLVDLAGSERVGKTGLSSLRFASRMKLITTEPSINEKYDAERMVKNLEKELILLKQELAIHDSLANRAMVTYDPMDEVQIAEINSQVRRYLDGSLEEIDIINLRQIQEVFNQFKVILSQQEQEVEANLRKKYTLINKNDYATITAVQKAGLVDVEGNTVGETDGQGFGLGIAPFSAKPGKKGKIKKSYKDIPGALGKKDGLLSPVSGKDGESISTSRTQLLSSSKEADVKDVLSRDREASGSEPIASDSPKEDSRMTRPATPPPKPSAFEEFKNERGSEINRIFKQNKTILNDRRKKASETAQRINSIKKEIDTTKEALDVQKTFREEQGEYENKGLMIIDEEEFLLILKLKELKKQYRGEYQDLRDLKAEIQYCQHLVDQCRQRLLTEFDIWYNESFLIPEEMQASLKAKGSIRLGLFPLTKLTSLAEDDEEKFGQIQASVLPDCPDSVSFYNARMKFDQKQNYSKTMASFQNKTSGLNPTVLKEKSQSDNNLP